MRAGLAGFLRSLGYAGAGLRLAARQRNFRIQLAVLAAVLLLCAWLQIDRAGWATVLLAAGLVLAMEAMNTALEATVDLLSPEPHPLAGAAKDAAAAAVLIAAAAALLVGLLVLGPPLWARLG